MPQQSPSLKSKCSKVYRSSAALARATREIANVRRAAGCKNGYLLCGSTLELSILENINVMLMYCNISKTAKNGDKNITEVV
jgi:hypothetical protein